jgi:putative ABC transport system permease protein
MLAYQLRIALKSLRRNPVMSTLLVAGIALGIAISTSSVTTYYMLSGNPIPEKSDRLFHVAVDSWDPDSDWDSDRPELQPNQLTYIDVRGIMESDIPTYQTVAYKASMTVQPEGETESDKPYREIVRMCFADFFTMFEVPFKYGGSWDAEADHGPEPVVVIDAETNRKLFGGGNSVGETVRLDNRDYTVVGVLDGWDPLIHFYDVNNDPFEDPEAIYMPFNFVEPYEIRTAGNTSGWKFYPGNEFKDLLQSESTWLQLWVQLDTRQQQDQYESFLDAYTLEQRASGRFQRPTNNKIWPVMEWLDREQVVPDQAKVMLIIGILFLVVCSVNLIGILLGKFLARAPEVGVRRALGASRTSVFLQHIVECELLGVIGGVVGMGLSMLVLRVLNRWFDGQFDFQLDLNMVLAAVALSLGAGLIAGLYPSWRICRVQPANYLKIQ